MFGTIQPTPFDLRFRLFAIPVTVSPWFWAVGIFSGWSPDHFDLVIIWIGCLFVSILVHEMGHALTAQTFGWPPEVYLYQFGGLAVFRPGYGHTTARSVLVSLAGPGAGFVLYGLVKLLQIWLDGTIWYHTLDPVARDRLDDFFLQMEWINLGWGLVNLLPVLPLDGGRVAEALLMRFRPFDGRHLTIMLSIAASAAAAFYFVLHKDHYTTFPAILFGILCISNVQSLQQRNPW